VLQLTRVLFPSCLFAGIAVVLFYFAPFSASDTAAESLLFEARFSASADGAVRLSYDRGSGFLTHEISSATVQAAPHGVARFLVPGGNYQRFRLAAVGVPGAIRMDGARITDLDGNELAHFGKDQLQVDGEGAAADIVCTPALTLRSSLASTSDQAALAFAVVALVTALVLWRFGSRLKEWGAPIGAALTRRVESARRRPLLTLFAVAALASIASCHPVIFSGKSFLAPGNRALCLYAGFPTLPGSLPEKIENPKLSDIAAMLWAHMPYSVLENHAIFRDRELPLRIRENSCGVPLLGQGQSMIGDPLHWIPLCAGGAAWAWDVKFILAKILFAFGVGLLVRAAVGRLGVAAALAASSAFIGFFSYRFNHAAFFSLSYAPWILLAWLQIARAPAWRAGIPSVVLLIVANWCELNSGTAKESSMLIAGLNCAGLMALVLGPESIWVRARKLAAAAAGLLIFLLVSAPCWLLFLDALSHAWTTSAVPHAYQIQPSLFLGLFDDLFYRQTMPRESHTNPSANFFLLIGILWALVHLRRLAADRLFLALALAAVPILALVFGAIPPALLVRLPLVGNISHVDNTFSCVLLILLFPLAGFGLQTCLDRMSTADWRGDWMLSLLLITGLGAAYFGYIQVETRAADALIRETGAVTKSAFFVGYATALFLAVALLPWIARRLLAGRAWKLANVLLALLCVGVLHFRHGMYVATKFDDYVMNPKERVNFQTPSPAVEYVKRNLPEPARVAGFGTVLSPGFNAVLGLESATGADAIQNRYYREFVDASQMPVIWGWSVQFRKEAMPALLPFYDLLNLRYYLATPDTEPLAVAGLKRIGTSDLDVYESPTVWPRAFFTDRVARYQTPEEFARIVSTAERRPLAATQEVVALAGNLPSELTARQVVAATGYRLTGNTTTFTIAAPAAGVVVLTEAFEAENFRVILNGAPAPYFRVNHAFCGVSIPHAGNYLVRFEYWPRRLTLALWLSAAGLTLLAAGASWLKLSPPVPAA